MSNIIAFALNNIVALAAGGLLAAWLSWRMWQKVERYFHQINSFSELALWAGKFVVIVGVLFYVGRWIYGTVNAAVIAAINSPSTQVAGQSLVELGGAVDQLVSGGYSFDMGGNSGGNLVEFLPSADGINIETEASTNAGENSTVSTFEMKPLTEMFQAAASQAQMIAVNASIDAPANAPVGEYIVQPGDSIGAIAKRLGIDAKALCVANGLSNCSLINVGQKLVLPGAVAKELLETVATETSQKIAAPRPTAAGSYVAPKLNQSYLPKAWNVIEQGQMSVGQPANLSTPSNEPVASWSVVK